MSYGTIDTKCLSFHGVTGVSLVGGAVTSDDPVGGEGAPRVTEPAPAGRVPQGAAERWASATPDVPTSLGVRAGASVNAG